jgi:hypothetical protein
MMLYADQHCYHDSHLKSDNHCRQDTVDASNDKITLDFDDKGCIFVRSQATDYQLRGLEMNNMNMMDFFVDTYEEDIKRGRESGDAAEEEPDGADTDDSDTEADNDQPRKPGRPRHKRIRYLEGHPQREQKQRVF